MSFRILALALCAFFAACPPCIPNGSSCQFECATNADCKDGKLCMHEHAHDGNLDICVAPCTYSATAAPSFRCPDSPDGSACKKDDGSTFCPNPGGR